MVEIETKFVEIEQLGEISEKGKKIRKIIRKKTFFVKLET